MANLSHLDPPEDAHKAKKAHLAGSLLLRGVLSENLTEELPDFPFHWTATAVSGAALMSA